MKVVVERAVGKEERHAPAGWGPTPENDRRHALLGLGGFRGERVVVRGRSAGRICHGMLGPRGAEFFIALDCGASAWFPVTDVEPE